MQLQKQKQGRETNLYHKGNKGREKYLGFNNLPGWKNNLKKANKINYEALCYKSKSGQNYYLKALSKYITCYGNKSLNQKK